MTERRFIGLVESRTSPIVQKIEVTFEGIGELVRKWSRGEKDGPGYVPADIEPGPRTRHRVKSVSFLVLDVEAKTEKVDGVKRTVGGLPPSPEDFWDCLAAVNWRAHVVPTYSHMEPTGDGGNLGPRYRVIFDLSRALEPDELKPVAMHVASCLSLSDCVDTSCMDPARLFYRRRSQSEKPNGSAYTNGGEALNVDALLQSVAAERTALAKSSPITPETKDGDSVIQAFNAQADARKILEGNGYKPMGENLWLWPGSSTGVPGVKIFPESGRVYSHHAQDPLHGSHAHDAFSLWCVLEHGGDAREAVREAARLLGMARKQEPELGANRGQESGAWGAADTPTPPFEVVTISDLETADPPPPERVWGPLVPAGHVTLLSAHGGTGKSMVALMLCVAVALGRPLFDIPTRQGVAVFYSGEDGADLVRFRLKWICRCWGVNPRELDGRLFILDATDGEPTLFTEESGAGRREGVTTPTYAGLRAFMLQHHVSLVVVDNASDAFDASEIDRARVRGFVRSLARLARENAAGVLLLAHVDKGTSRGDRSSSAEAYSGSTAWHNSARSRLFMKRENDGCLLLEHQKWNVTEQHAALRLSWPKDGLPALDDSGQPVVKALVERGHIRALLRLIHEFNERGEHVSVAMAGPATAPRLLKGEAGYPPRLKDKDVIDLLRVAERKDWLVRCSYKTRSRHTAERWELTAAGMAAAGIEPNARVARVA